MFVDSLIYLVPSLLLFVVTQWQEYVYDGFLYSTPLFWEQQWSWTDNSEGEDHHEIVTAFEFQAVTETELVGNSATTHGSSFTPNGQQFIAEIRAVSGDDQSAPLIGGKCLDFGTGVPDDLFVDDRQRLRQTDQGRCA